MAKMDSTFNTLYRISDLNSEFLLSAFLILRKRSFEAFCCIYFSSYTKRTFEKLQHQFNLNQSVILSDCSTNMHHIIGVFEV